MNKREIVINGSNFDDEESFYKEIDSLFTKGLKWKTGHNLDAFNDILSGGFGVNDYDEAIKLIWIKFSKSRETLSNEFLKKVLEIIKSNEHIEFHLEE